MHAFKKNSKAAKVNECRTSRITAKQQKLMNALISR
jgi:hypothetical protein